MFAGEIYPSFDWGRVRVIDQEFTKSMAIADDDGSDIWLVEVDGVRAIQKRTHKSHRNIRVQLFIDEIKPAFGLLKMGCTLVDDPSSRAVLMRFHGRGQNLAHVPLRSWVYQPAIVAELVKMALLDLVTVNNNRLCRNVVLTQGVPPVVAIDEEKALDPDGLVTFRMSQDVRRAMILCPLDVSAAVAKLHTAVPAWTQTAARIFAPAHVPLVMAVLTERLATLPKDYFRYLDSRYSDGKKSGVKSKRARPPNPWDVPDDRKAANRAALDWSKVRPVR